MVLAVHKALPLVALTAALYADLAACDVDIAGFQASRWVQNDAWRYEEACVQGRHGDDFRALSNSYANLTRLLVVDARFQGVGYGAGDLVRQYAGWFAWAVRTRRALFILWAVCGDKSSAKEREKCGSLDLGAWFAGKDGVDWTWDASRIRVQDRLPGVRERVVYAQPRGDLTTPEALRAVLEGQDPWLTVRLAGGGGLIPQPAGSASDSLQQPFLRFVLQTGHALLLAGAADAAPDLEQDPQAEEGQPGAQLRACLLHWALHPRPRLQGPLMAVLEPLEDKKSLVALHIHTHYSDVSMSESAALTALEGHVPPWLDLRRWREGGVQERWGRLNEVLARGGLNRTNQDPALAECSLLHSPFRSNWMLGPRDAAGLQPFFTCAVRAAKDLAVAREGSAGGHEWGVYLATDAPLLFHLAPRLPQFLSIRGSLVHGCSRPGRGRCHVAHSAHAERGAGRRRAEVKAAAHAQLAVDAWMLGVADRVLGATGSSFRHFAERAPGPALRARLLAPAVALAPGAGGAGAHLPLCEGLQLEFNEPLCKAAYHALLEVEGYAGLREEAERGAFEVEGGAARLAPPAPAPAGPKVYTEWDGWTQRSEDGFLGPHDPHRPLPSPPLKPVPQGKGYWCPPPELKSLKIHIYPNQTDDYGEYASGRHISQILYKIRNDKRVYTADPEEANWFIIQYRGNKTNHEAGFREEEERAYLAHLQYLQMNYPYLNRSIAAGIPNHLILFQGDHGPGDFWMRRESLHCPNPAVPPHFNPACPDRAVAYAMFPGHHDFHQSDRGPEWREVTRCLVCMQRGKDVRMPSASFDRRPMWADAARESMLTYEGYNLADRSNFLSFTGQFKEVPEDEIWWGDPTGRAQLNKYINRTGWRIGKSFEPYGKTDANAALMSRSVFCYNPLGVIGGDSNRHVPGVLFGCIMVFLAHAGQVSRVFDDIIPWDKMSVTVDVEDLHRLPEILEAISDEEKEEMFYTMQRYFSYVQWGLMLKHEHDPAASPNALASGQVLGARPDAYEGLLLVLQHRVNLIEGTVDQEPQCDGYVRTPEFNRSLYEKGFCKTGRLALPHIPVLPRFPCSTESFPWDA